MRTYITSRVTLRFAGARTPCRALTVALLLTIVTRQSMIKSLADYIKRSSKYIKHESVKQWQGYKWEKELNLFTSNKNDWLFGNDNDLGGTSTIQGAITKGNLLLTGNLVVNSIDDKQTGYVGCRTRIKPLTLLHTPVWDVTLFRYLGICPPIPFPIPRVVMAHR